MDTLRTYIHTVQAVVRSTLVRRTVMSPKRDWYILLSVVVCVGLASIAVGVFRYHAVWMLTRDAANDTLEVSQVRTPEREAINALLETYREHERRFEALRLEAPPAPSVGGGAVVAPLAEPESGGDGAEEVTEGAVEVES